MDPKTVETLLEVHCPRCWPLPLTASAAPRRRHSATCTCSLWSTAVSRPSTPLPFLLLPLPMSLLYTPSDDNSLQVDTLTRQPCAVPVQIQLHSSPLHRATTLHTTTPCILPELSRVARVSVASPRYWSVTWSVNDAPPPPAGAGAQQVGLCPERKSPYVDLT
jgi:hypothetical protein